MRHGIVTVKEAHSGVGAVAGDAVAAGGRFGAASRASLPVMASNLDLSGFGIDADLSLDLGTTTRSNRRGAVGDASGPPAPAADTVGAATFFVEDLFRRNRVDLRGDPRMDGSPLQHPRSVTHRFESTGKETLRLRRVRVDCGFDVS